MKFVPIRERGQGPRPLSDWIKDAARAEGGKVLAMLLYNAGLAPMDATQSKFDRHPEWMRA